MLVLATIRSVSDGALCPARCRCNDDSLSAICASAALEVVPIQLNPEVRHIDLSNNRISNVNFTLFFYNNLISLDLSNNKIKSLGSTNFESQHNLKELNLNNNDIEKIAKDSLKGLRALTILDLSYNHLEELNWETFRELHSLQVLKLSRNRLVYLEEGLFKFAKHLRELLLDNNLLLEIPTAALINTHNLQYLSLSSNLLKSVEDGNMPNLFELKTLLLDKNVIDYIHQAALSGLVTLDHLDLSDNNFTAIPTVPLAKLSNITKLKLSGNFISIVPPVAFKGLFHLRLLKLDRQEVLEWIDVRAFVDNINLEKVWLDDNIAVERLPTRLFHGNPRITYLSVRNNRLTNLEVTHFPLDQLRVLKLAGNPLQCNCSLSWLWHLIQGQTIKSKKGETNQTIDNDDQQTNDLVIDLENIKCEGPEPLHNVLLVDATESQLNCSIGWIAGISAAATILFIMAIVGGFLYWTPPIRMRINRKRDIDINGITEPKCRTKINTTTACPNGRIETFEGTKIERIPAPTLHHHHDYRALPSWDIYGADCASTINIYEQLDVNHKTSRPHIVYV